MVAFVVLHKELHISVGYSGSDLRALCEEAAMMPIRELGPQNILTIKANQVLVPQFLNLGY
jgi:SpoVK/Ycf46/Vps4 family AAA+-type ATPase